jgi:hypothetical protein
MWKSIKEFLTSTGNINWWEVNHHVIPPSSFNKEKEREREDEKWFEQDIINLKKYYPNFDENLYREIFLDDFKKSLNL